MIANKNHNKSSGVYLSNDNIINFKFCVTLKKIDSLIKIPSFDIFQESVEEKNECERIGISWQEKILSDSEILIYNSIENCKTEIHKKYHENIKKKNLMEKLEKQKMTYSIFTYTDDDDYKFKDDLKDDIVMMYVMATLKNKEILLFKIQWNLLTKTLILYPDFNDIEKNPYCIEIDTDSRDLYYYGIENLSKRLDITSIESKLDFKKLSLATLDKLENLEKSYQYPSTPFSRNILFLFEIISLENFEYNNCHVRYFISLPKYTNLIDGHLEGTTHSSYKNTKNNNWSIGFCFDIFLSSDSKELNNLKIYFEIISIDFFGRERIEGRSFLSIPHENLFDTIKLNCYREMVGNGFYDKITRFFIGGRNHFNFLEFNGEYQNDDCEVTKINRYGNNTKSTGSIIVKYQKIIQHHPKFDFFIEKTDDLESNQLFSRIDQIVSRYIQAKKRYENSTK